MSCRCNRTDRTAKATDKKNMDILCAEKHQLGTSLLVPTLRKIKSSGRFPIASKLESRVLVIHTGGTIGMMKNTEKALVPIPDAMVTNIRRFPELHDEEYANERFGHNDNPNTLVLPDVDEKFRVVYSVSEYEPLLDSSNMTVTDWIHIAKNIQQSYMDFDGFVVLHGTDTLAYTASALSFMLENLGKPVVLTGSQIPIFEARTDGRDNFLGALIIAGNYNVPEVTVFFGNKLFRGNRTTKISSNNFNAFNSLNMPPLVTLGLEVEVDYKAIFHPIHIEKFRVHSSLNNNVGLLRLFPSITTATVKAFLQPPIEGVVLQTYGAGNIPSNREDLIDELRSAINRGVLIVNCTQCTQGGVSATLYETGKTLSDIGVTTGGDMTPEAALTKLSYVLSKTSWDLATKHEMMQSNLRGELSLESKKDDAWDLVDAVAQCLNISSAQEIQSLNEILYPAILCSTVASANLDKLTFYTDQGADLSAYNSDYRTPLHVACCEGKLKVVEHLLLHGASVHMKDRFDNTPLQNAIEFDHHSVIEVMIECGAHITGSLTQLGEKLCSASSRGHIKRLRSYHLAKADLNQQDISGNTALHMAALHRRIECVKFLVSTNNIDVEVKNMRGETAADIARMMNYIEVLNLIEGAANEL